MKKIFFLCFLLLASYSESQNLVPNGDFEYYTSCPTSPGQVNFAAPWYDPTGATSDYYNACAPVLSGVSVPYQSNGVITAFQNAHSGVGYAGLFTTQNNGSNYREYIQVLLSDSLVSGSCYYVSFYVNLFNMLKYGSNNIGAYISPVAITTTAPNVLNYIPQIMISGNPVVSDTINWIKISGLYIANGGEKYITIGNFQNDSNTTVEVVDTANPLDGCFYYIDDVSIINCADTATSIYELQQDYKIKLYPNPNNGTMTLEYHLAEAENGLLSIYDVSGKQVKQITLSSKVTTANLNETELEAGIYYYSIFVNNKTVKTEKLIIIK